MYVPVTLCPFSSQWLRSYVGVCYVYETKMNSETMCCCLVAQPCPTLCDPVECGTPSLPVLHHLSAFAQTHVQGIKAAK